MISIHVLIYDVNLIVIALVRIYSDAKISIVLF